MSRRKYKTYEAKPYEPFESYGYIKDGQHYFFPILSNRERKDSVAGVTMCMLSHPAFKDLKPRQRLLYLYAKAQYKQMAERKEFEEKYPQYKGHPEYIYLNNKLMVDVFEMYSKHTVRELYSDIKVLTEHGFIVPVGYDEESQRIIYKLIAEWQEWNPHKKYVPKLGKSLKQIKATDKRVKQSNFNYEWVEVL